MSYCVDANVFITAWHETYPPDVMSALYTEMENKLSSKIILIKPIFDEIEPILNKKSREQLENDHPVRLWLTEKLNIKETPIDNGVNQRALELMNKYETDEGPRGANSEDIKLIAFASLNTHKVVTLESEQEEMPKKKSNYKIPLICQQENVRCINFIGLLRECNISI